MRVDIDEARRDHAPGGVDGPVGGLRIDATDADDPSVVDTDVRAKRRQP